MFFKGTIRNSASVISGIWACFLKRHFMIQYSKYLADCSFKQDCIYIKWSWINEASACRFTAEVFMAVVTFRMNYRKWMTDKTSTESSRLKNTKQDVAVKDRRCRIVLLIKDDQRSSKKTWTFLKKWEDFYRQNSSGQNWHREIELTFETTTTVKGVHQLHAALLLAYSRRERGFIS